MEILFQFVLFAFISCFFPIRHPSSAYIRSGMRGLLTLVFTNVIGCDLCLLRSHPIFRSHCPTDRIRFLLYLSHNAFRTMIEMNNRMRSIRWSLTCQSPSDSIRFFKIASDRPIVRSHCPIFPPIFHPIRQTIK